MDVFNHGAALFAHFITHPSPPKKGQTAESFDLLHYLLDKSGKLKKKRFSRLRAYCMNLALQNLLLFKVYLALYVVLVKGLPVLLVVGFNLAG